MGHRRHHCPSARKGALISGDGGFLFSANELETAVRLNSHLVHMIWIDGHYDMVGTQERLEYGRTSEKTRAS